TDNFPTEPNYMGSRQQFVQSGRVLNPAYVKALCSDPTSLMSETDGEPNKV
ncbi:hypothetical protein JOQ06_009449, partial [Pogonophryne albipinna]